MTYYGDKEGNVFNENGRPMKFWINPSGYYYFKMYYDGKGHGTSVHRFIWEYFHGNIPEGNIVIHKNKDKLDNRLENLMLSTNRETTRKRDYAKLNMELAFQIREDYSTNIYSYSELAAMYNVSKTTISNCIKQKTWQYV